MFKLTDDFICQKHYFVESRKIGWTQENFISETDNDWHNEMNYLRYFWSFLGKYPFSDEISE